MNLTTPQSPPGEGANQRSDLNSTLNEDCLMNQMPSYTNIEAAWKRVKSNKGVPGVDGMSIEDFPDCIKPHWRDIREQLRDGSYRPLPVKRVKIPKPDGGERSLGIPTVMDRVIQQAIAQVIPPYFEPSFSNFSYGYRPGRNAKQAVTQIRSYIKEGYKIAVDLDLSKFFDEVNQDLLMNRIGRKIRDKAILRLLGLYLRAGIADTESGLLIPTRKGVPQGGLCKALHKPPYA